MVALVGYTNAGKSTLMNRLTNADVMAADVLFATLIPRPGGSSCLAEAPLYWRTRWASFRSCPTQLIAAFRATLEELESADMLLHVVDASHPQALQQQQAVQDVLHELGIKNRPMIRALNKVDLLDRVPDPLPDDTVAISAMSASVLSGSAR